MLHDALNSVFGSTTKVRLLRALLPLTSAVSGREAGVRSMGGAQRALTELAQLATTRARPRCWCTRWASAPASCRCAG